jgi:hypothetical protein
VENVLSFAGESDPRVQEFVSRITESLASGRELSPIEQVAVKARPELMPTSIAPPHGLSASLTVAGLDSAHTRREAAGAVLKDIRLALDLVGEQVPDETVDRALSQVSALEARIVRGAGAGYGYHPDYAVLGALDSELHLIRELLDDGRATTSPAGTW